MSLDHGIVIYSDDEDDNMNDAEKMLEPGYVNIVCDDRAKMQYPR